jgi:hypothetical protein
MFGLFGLAKKVESIAQEVAELNEKMDKVEKIIDFHLEKVHGMKSNVKKIEVKAE